MLARRMLVVTLALAGLGCSSKEESNLAKLADQKPEVAPREGQEVAEAGEDEGGVVDPTGVPVGGPPSEDPPSGPVDADGNLVPAKDGAAQLLTPGADADRIQLALALEEGARYRMTTIGMLKLPLIEKPTGFAREEELELSDCEGEGTGRRCRLSHRYVNYEAEPPAGAGLEADEKQVAQLVSSHVLDASGLRASETTVEGEASPYLTQQLGEIHRFFCVRLPSEPVGVGATWKDVCRMRQGGALVTRELTWRLAKVEPGEDGTRAELEYAGRARRIDAKGRVVSGEVQGVLYFWVDAGEPHMMRERVALVLNADKGMSSVSDYRYQFAKLDGDTVIRTDGKPFEQSLALNDPRRVPNGATRDDELPAKKRDKKSK